MGGHLDCKAADPSKCKLVAVGKNTKTGDFKANFDPE